MSSTLTFSTQLLGRTEKAANAILNRLLAEPGLTEQQWIALNLSVTNADAVGVSQLAAQVAGALKVSQADARSRILELEAAHLLKVAEDERAPVEVTADGQQLYTQIQAAVTRVTE